MWPRPATSFHAGSRRCSPKGETAFKNGSGRLELAERIFSDAPGLAARVIVNRVWGWHFGRPLVTTPSDFGTQGDKPTHPQLLDDLAARFIDHGWSLKWLSKEIMLSAAYQQTSKPREDALKADEANALLWRQNPRRLDIEAYRDTLVRAAGVLDEEMGGISGDLDSDTFTATLDLRTHQPRAHAAVDAACTTSPKRPNQRPVARSRLRRCSRFSS